ncbi:phosphoglycerate mutase-like protein, partial [Scleroderma citrinum]
EEPLDVRGYPLAPPGLQLEQVHIFVRHGERTPVRIRMTDPPASLPERWQMCSAARQFSEAVDLTVPTAPSQRTLWFKKAVETKGGSTAPGLWHVLSLTDLGRETTFSFGRALRKLYVDRLGFLPKVLQHESQAYFRSTYVDRTIESLEQIVYGLYPPTQCAANVVPPIFTRNRVEDNLVSNILGCPKLGLLEEQFTEAAAARWNPRLEGLDKKLSKYIKGKPIRIDGQPRASGILDSVRSAAAHGIPVPPEFWDPEIVNLLETAVSDEWFSLKTEEGRRLGMGRLLADISARMLSKVVQGNKDPLKILVHSTHDSTLAALCATFDVFDEKWPPFTSSVTFELFKKASRPEPRTAFQALLGERWRTHTSLDDYYIRMRYKNRNMVLPLCAEEGKHLPGSPEFCTLSAFQRRVKELTPVNWASECGPRT